MDGRCYKTDHGELEIETPRIEEEIPCVASPVGVNTEIIQDGVNGFLAKDEKEWIEKLSLLIKNSELRQRLGKAGRKTVEERYSVKVWAPRYVKLVRDIIKTGDTNES